MDSTSAVLDQLTPLDKHKLFAAIAREFIRTDGGNRIPVADETSMVGYFVPIGSKAEIISNEERSPYLDEIRERAKNSTASLSVDEFLNRLDADQAV